MIKCISIWSLIYLSITLYVWFTVAPTFITKELYIFSLVVTLPLGFLGSVTGELQSYYHIADDVKSFILTALIFLHYRLFSMVFDYNPIIKIIIKNWKT